MEFMAAGWCTGKWLRLYQTIRNLTSGDVGIPLVVIRPGVAGWKKFRLLYLVDLFEGRGGKEKQNYSEIHKHLNNIKVPYRSAVYYFHVHRTSYLSRNRKEEVLS